MSLVSEELVIGGKHLRNRFVMASVCMKVLDEMENGGIHSSEGEIMKVPKMCGIGLTL